MEAMSIRKFKRCLEELQKLKDKEWVADYKVEIAEKYLKKMKTEKVKIHRDKINFESRLRSVIIQKSDGSIEYGYTRF